MSNRSKLLIAGVLVLIAVILIILFLPKPKPTTNTPTANQTNTNQNTNSQPTNTTPSPPPEITPEQKQRASAETVTKIFVERFGSYSSESEAENLEDLLPLTTSTYRATLESQIAKLRSAGVASTYYGVTTRFLSATTVEMDTTSGIAIFDVLTQREEATGSVGNTAVKYQTLTVNLKLVGEDWLVNGAVWK